MNQAIRGIDFEIEPENPGAVALFFHGAQGGLVQDVTVRLAYHTASACDLSGSRFRKWIDILKMSKIDIHTAVPDND